MTKPVIIVNFAYKSPTGQGYGKGPGALRTMLRYFQYRDRRNNWLSKNRGYIRWIDRGMGKHHREIFKQCEALQSEHVMAWTFVVSPAPDLMTLVPERQRRAFISDLTERVVEDYYTARGLDNPQYSYVIHTAKTKATDEEPSREHLHTHVVLPGTVSSMAERLPVYNNTSKGHDKLFREIAAHHFSTMLDQTIGVEWRRLRPDMTPALDANIQDRAL